METPNSNEFGIVARIISLLEGLDREAQQHVLTTVATWLHLEAHPRQAPGGSLPTPSASRAQGLGFSEREEMSPKQFLVEKEPHSDTDRIACLAYYLTHYRDMRQFKTAELSKLNTEAAQRRFTNAAYTAKNALRDGFLAPASKSGHRQLSAMGEQYVNALPDREAAQAIRRRMTPKRTRRTKPSSSARKTPT